MSHVSTRPEQSTDSEVDTLTSLDNLGVSASGEFIRKTGSTTFANATPAAGTSLNFSDNETPSGSIDGANTTFILSNSPSPASSVILTLGRQVQIQGTDYTLSGSTITYTTAPPSGLSGEPHKIWYRF